MMPPATPPLEVKLISRYLPNRLELWFITVWALPNASSTGLICEMRSFSVELELPARPEVGPNMDTAKRREYANQHEVSSSMM